MLVRRTSAMVAILLGFLAFGGIGFAQSSTAPQHRHGKVPVCHRTATGKSVTIRIRRATVAAHLARGDTLGRCPRHPKGKRRSHRDEGDDRR